MFEKKLKMKETDEKKVHFEANRTIKNAWCRR